MPTPSSSTTPITSAWPSCINCAGGSGRSTIQAYAYFLHDRTRAHDPGGSRALETLRETGGIGAGYSISMRDLEMRGAGDMLGAKQSGHIASVGFDLYTRLLSHEVNVLRAMRDGTPLPPRRRGRW